MNLGYSNKRSRDPLVIVPLDNKWKELVRLVVLRLRAISSDRNSILRKQKVKSSLTESLKRSYRTINSLYCWL